LKDIKDKLSFLTDKDFEIVTKYESEKKSIKDLDEENENVKEETKNSVENVNPNKSNKRDKKSIKNLDEENEFVKEETKNSVEDDNPNKINLKRKSVEDINPNPPKRSKLNKKQEDPEEDPEDLDEENKIVKKKNKETGRCLS